MGVLLLFLLLIILLLTIFLASMWMLLRCVPRCHLASLRDRCRHRCRHMHRGMGISGLHLGQRVQDTRELLLATGNFWSRRQRHSRPQRGVRGRTPPPPQPTSLP